jgi:hypothetical protein
MASKPKQPAGPPMTLGNTRELGVWPGSAVKCIGLVLCFLISPALGQSPAVDNLKNQYEKCARRAYLAEEVTGQFVKPDAAADRVLYACRSEDNALHSLLETSLSNDSMARIVMDKFRRRLKNDLMESFNELNIRNGMFPR